MAEDYSKYINSANKRKSDELIKKKAEAIANGRLADSKPSAFRNFKDEIIKSDFQSIASSVIGEIVIPKVVDLISNAFESGLYMLFHGDLKGYRSNSNSGRHDYTIYSNSSSTRLTNNVYNASVGYRDIRVDDLNDAKEIVMKLEEILDGYGEITISDLYAIAGIHHNNKSFDEWGWHYLRKAPIIKSGNSYLIKMPRPEKL